MNVENPLYDTTASISVLRFIKGLIGIDLVT